LGKSLQVAGWHPVAADGRWLSKALQMAGWHPIAADGRWLSKALQMAGWHPVAADGRQLSKALQRAGWHPIAADGRQLSKALQMAGWQTCRRREPCWDGILAPVSMGLRPKPRSRGPNPDCARAWQGGFNWTASNREGYGLGGPIIGPD
jgi:hypothetical protein